VNEHINRAEERIASLGAQEAATCVSELPAALSGHEAPRARLVRLLERLRAWGLIEGQHEHTAKTSR
jgi:hypothetical protein